MKRIGILSLTCVLVLFFATSTFAWYKPKPKPCPPPCPKCDPCIYKSSQNQLPAGVWSEKLIGGQHGNPGNLLFASGGNDWKFEGATLAEDGVIPLQDIINGVLPLLQGPPFNLPDWSEFALNQPCYLTKYIGGTFTFNKFSPWCCKESLVAEDVTAFNYSCKPVGFGEFATFTVKFFGTFADGVAFEAIGHYSGIPKLSSPDANKDQVQSGCLDSVELIIKGDIKGACVDDAN
jgi:hypothetical protein